MKQKNINDLRRTGPGPRYQLRPRLGHTQAIVSLRRNRRRVRVDECAAGVEDGVGHDSPGGDGRRQIGRGPEAHGSSDGTSRGNDEAAVGELREVGKSRREHDAKNGAAAAGAVLRGGAV